MAILKVYRLAYIFNGGSDLANVLFSDWVRIEDMASVEAKVNAVQPEGDGSPEGVKPTHLGWEEKTLDTEPV